MMRKSVAAHATKGLGLALATTVLMLAGAASAGDYGNWNDGWRDGQPEAWRHRERERRERPVYGGNGLPSVLPGIGTYTGGLSAVRVPGSGVYIQVDHDRGARARPGNPIVDDSGETKVIHVSPSNSRRACSYEAGVCVVRP